MWRQRYIEFRLGQVSEEMGEDAPYLELSSGERERSRCLRVTEIMFEMWTILDIAVAEYVRLDGPGNVLAHAFLSSSKVSEVHVDNSEKWHIELTANPNDTVHLLYMLTHEIGHALGLYHSPQKNFDNSDQLCDEDERRRYGEYGCRSMEKDGT
ncbi:stromelysin-1-like [Pogonomyrmex barbatus]|uniref:Stromelysin-1-like n=1 Tax=Pogonomyrmex barbatus TaxID=144034 RepID=A0A6I9W3Y3_9HYME|nr:stromelysin-1-like [Pogonomyrmex barbatus]